MTGTPGMVDVHVSVKSSPSSTSLKAGDTDNSGSAEVYEVSMYSYPITGTQPNFYNRYYYSCDSALKIVHMFECKSNV